MRTISGPDLAPCLRVLCDSVASRLWIASPFIGGWTAVQRILGTRWIAHGQISVRLLTDDVAPAFLNSETLRAFGDRGSIRLLAGLHAKIFVVDDQALVTSANLTETAFTKRREVGVLLDGVEAEDVINLFSGWWNSDARETTASWIEALNEQRSAHESSDEPSCSTLEQLWPLPPPPGRIQRQPRDFATYRHFLKCYNELADHYATAPRLWPSTPLFLELDALLDFLFHHAPGRPAKQWHQAKSPRSLSSQDRTLEIRRRAREFEEWVAQSPDDQNWRYKRWMCLRPILAKSNMQHLTWEQARVVVRALNCMRSLPLHITRFLNPRNNDLNTIRRQWDLLLHGAGPIEWRMDGCKAALYSFGKSSVQELLGWFNPEQFPLRNSNSDAGLRYFGYTV